MKNRDSLLLSLCSVFVLVSAADLLNTWYHLSNGLGEEIGLIMSWMIPMIGLIPALLLNMAASVAGMAIIYRIGTGFVDWKHKRSIVSLILVLLIVGRTYAVLSWFI